MISANCSDGIDNDGDSYVDVLDSGCRSTEDASEVAYGYQQEESGNLEESCAEELLDAGYGATCIEDHYVEMSWLLSRLNPTASLQTCLDDAIAEGDYRYYSLTYDASTPYTGIALSDCIFDHATEYESEILAAYNAMPLAKKTIAASSCMSTFFDDYSSHCGKDKVEPTICEGYDMSFPEEVSHSPYGEVMSGYGYPDGKWENTNNPTHAFYTVWADLQGQTIDGKAISKPGVMHKEMDTLLKNYGKESKGNGQTNLYLSIRGGPAGTEAPSFIGAEYGVDSMEDLVDTFRKDESILKDTQDWDTTEDWLEYYDTFAYAYPFWEENYLDARRDFYALLGNYLYGTDTDCKLQYFDGNCADLGQNDFGVLNFACLGVAGCEVPTTVLTCDTDTDCADFGSISYHCTDDNVCSAGHAYGSLVTKVNLIGEFGLVSSYIKLGFIDLETVDGVAEDYFRSVIEEAKFPAENLLMNLNVGGRPYREYAKLAGVYGTGLGTHGLPSIFPYQQAQLRENIAYDQNLQAYTKVDDLDPVGPYSFLHSDAEMLDETDNTLGQYYLFRTLTQGAVSLGFNSLLLTKWTFPSEDFDCSDTSDERCDNWDAQELDKEEDKEYIEWIHKSIGRPADDTVEAFCSLAQMGVDIPDDETETFEEMMANIKSSDDWEFGDQWEHYLRTPLITHFGHYCTYDQTVENGKGRPALLMDEDRIGETDPTPKKWWAGGPSDDESRLYEGKTTISPEDFSESEYEDEDHSLFFILSDDYVDSSVDYVVKVVFENNNAGSGEWVLGYAGDTGWTETDAVNFDSTMTGYLTASFLLEDAAFDHSGPSETDLAIRSSSGTNAAFILIRVIKVEETSALSFICG